MKPIERYILYLIGLVAILLFYFKKPVPVDNSQITVKLKYDSIPVVNNNSTIEKPVVFKPGEINIPAAQLNILQSTDTALLKSVLKEVLARYYDVNVQHTTTADTSVIIETWDTITENKLQGRKLQYKILRPTQIITNNPKVGNKVFAGFYLETGAKGLYAVAPQISFENKRGTLLSLNYNVYNAIAKKDNYTFGVSLQQKISLRK